MKLKTFIIMEYGNELADGNIPKVDLDELAFVLDSIYADCIWLEDFTEAFGLPEEIDTIIDFVLDPVNREGLIRFGLENYSRDFNEEVGRREYTASAAYYNGVSDPDEDDFGDGYPVDVDDIHTPEFYTQERGFHRI